MTSDKDLFKNIGNYFEKRNRFFNKSQDRSTQIGSAVKDFLKEKFGDNLIGYSITVSYQVKDNSLLITTDNKIIANELAIRLDSLTGFLKDRRIRLDRILVR